MNIPVAEYQANIMKAIKKARAEHQIDKEWVRWSEAYINGKKSVNQIPTLVPTETIAGVTGFPVCKIAEKINMAARVLANYEKNALIATTGRSGGPDDQFFYKRAITAAENAEHLNGELLEYLNQKGES